MRRIAPLFVALLLLTLPASAQNPAAGEGATLAPMLEWPTFPDALKAAKESNRIVVVDVWSRNCGWCRKQQTEVYTQPDLQAYLLGNFELGRLDIDLDSDTLSYRGYTLSSQMLSAGFGATATPTTIFLEPDGTYITRLAGFHAYDDFFGVIRYIGSQAFREMSFEDFLKQEGD